MAYLNSNQQDFCIDVNFLPTIVKAEVKERIKRRRKAENRGELVVDLRPQTPQTPSEQDLAMQADRRMRNNEAARKYRQKLRLRHNNIQKDYQKLKEERRKLEITIEELRKHNLFLMNVLKKCEESCHVQALKRRMESPKPGIDHLEINDIRPYVSQSTFCEVNQLEFWHEMGCQWVPSEMNYESRRLGGGRVSQRGERHASLSSTDMSSTPSPLDTPPSFTLTHTPEYTNL